MADSRADHAWTNKEVVCTSCRTPLPGWVWASAAAAQNEVEMHSQAREGTCRTASGTGSPLARPAAMALASVHPVPWLLPVLQKTVTRHTGKG